MVRRFAMGVALATGFALSLTGCLGASGNEADKAGESREPTAAQVLAKAAEKVGELRSFKVDVSMRMTESGHGDLSLRGSMRQQIEPEPAFQVSYSEIMADGERVEGMDHLMVGGTVYFRPPTARGTASAPWIKMSAEESERFEADDLGTLALLVQHMDPVQNTKMLTASENVRDNGKEKVDGTETTQYIGTYPMEEGIAKLPAEQQRVHRDDLAWSTMENMRFDLWLDDRHLPRRINMRWTQPEGDSVDATFTYSNFDKPTKVTAPSKPDQIISFGEYLESVGGLPRA